MKLKIVLLFFVFPLCTHHIVYSQAISVGDIAFLGYNSDNPDQFSIIATNYIESGTPIFFTDAGWNGSSFYASEGHFQWNVPVGGLPTNTIITFTGSGAGGFTIFGTGLLEPGANASLGTLSATASTSSMAFTTVGDQILCYTGSIASPNFIACINFNGFWSPATTSSTTSIPTGLTDGLNCALLNNQDNGIVDCNLLPDPATVADYNNLAYWIFNDATRYTLPPVIGPCDLLLPVELTDFYAEQTNNSIQLHWTTSSEIDLDQFIIEKRIGNGEFFEIGNINAAGYTTTQQLYQFTDDMINASLVYYRLQIVDMDQSLEYSNIIAVNASNNQGFSFNIFPNPVEETLSIQLNNSEKDIVFIELLNASGQSIKIQQNYQNSENIITLNLENLNSGLYFLNIIDSQQERNSIKFIKN